MPVTKYIDAVAVLGLAPFVFLAELPLYGYVLGAVAWILSRAGASFVADRAKAQENVKQAIGMNIAAMMGRAWLVALCIVVAGTTGTKDDGAMAAVTVLIAFTVYFGLLLLVRSMERKPTVT